MRPIPAQIFDEETATKDKENLRYNAAETLDAAAAAAGFEAAAASGAGAGGRRRSSSSSSSSSSGGGDGGGGGGDDGGIDKQRQAQPDKAQQQQQQQQQQPEDAKRQSAEAVAASALGSENFSAIVRCCLLYLWRDVLNDEKCVLVFRDNTRIQFFFARVRVFIICRSAITCTLIVLAACCLCRYSCRHHCVTCNV
jgi:hypothetical protein